MSNTEPAAPAITPAALDPLGAGHPCAACDKPTQGNHACHRDGMDLGPEVPLCDECGQDEHPTLGLIWATIKAKRLRRREAKALQREILAIHERNKREARS